MNRVHTLIISPKYRPYNDGLSDYTFYFLDELKRKNKGLKFTLLTSDDPAIRKFSFNDHDIYPIIKKWDGPEILPIIRLVNNQKPENILIQYVPTMYGRAGINFFFPWLLLFLRVFYKHKIILMAHELHYPFEKNLKSGFIFFWHIWNLFLLSLASSSVLTTTENFTRILKKFPFNSKKVHQLVVGSNIPREKIINDISCDKMNLVIFGSLHPSREPLMVFNSLKNYFQKFPETKIHIHVIGVNQADVLTLVNSNKDEDFDWKNFTFHGKLNEIEVAKTFNFCHFSINFFIDGISSRRGSAIAALNLGLPIITNFTNRSDSLFLKQDCILIKGGTPEEFQEQLQDELKRIESMSTEEYKCLREKSFNFIDQYFDWDIIGKRYMKLVGSDK